MKFSIVIPVYNRAHLVKRTLDSVLNQSFREFEVIIVDDGSTDALETVLGDYTQAVRLVRQKNRGPGAARNAGIEAAVGEYVVFLDSDDLWPRWTLSLYDEVIRRYPEASFITSAGRPFDTEPDLAQIPCRMPRIQRFLDYFAAAHDEIWIGTCGVAVKTDVVQQVGGFTDRRINGEDSDLWMRLGDAPGFVYISDPPVFYYRRQDGSAVANSWRSFLGGVHMISAEKSGRYPGGRSRRRERLTIISRHLRPKVLRMLHEGRVREAVTLYKHSFWWNFQLGRFRFLAGFPALICLRQVAGRFGYGPSNGNVSEIGAQADRSTTEFR